MPLCILLAGLFMIPVSGMVADSNEAKASEIPEWVQNFKLKGDLRLRYQGEDDNADGDKRQRFRMRFRPGVTAKITDQWSVGFGLATGSSDLRSTNQTLTEFQTYNINLDYAYAIYSPSDAVEIMAGKIKNPVWGTKDLVWDSDIRPDGFAATFTFEPSDSMSWYLTPAFYVLGDKREKSGDDNFETMMLAQGGINTKFNDNAYLKAAAAVYVFNDVEPGMFAESKGTNTEQIDNAYTLDAEFGFTGAPIFFAVFGQYVASDADNDSAGYLMGVKFGDKSVKSLGQWQVKYNYRDLEANAIPDFLPDSDAMGGSTGIEGSEIEATVGLAKNITFGVDYYMMKDKLSGDKLDLIQLDLVLKF